ncbi:MAG TPA: HupE/UreJ family protein [Bryobacterales bacterium]|nr:HupE/UreJ family protein [Bryobacterales bacterium]
MKRCFFVAALVAALTAAPLLAHMMSMSTGELRLEGDHAQYELRMPLYEITHVKQPETALLQNFHLYDGPAEARLVKHLCEADPAQDVYICRAEYQFPAAVKNLAAACTFAAVTVPNHVHVLHAERDGVSDQAIFDYSYTRAALRFTPPGRAAMAFSQVWAGALRAAAGLAQLLFLLALVMAARRRRELCALAAAFLAGEAASALLLAYGSWSPAPRFVEAAAALTIAYLAVEILLLPEAGYRWAVAAALGVFHGFYFGLFLRESQMHPLPVLAGVVVTELLLLALFAWLLARLARAAQRLQPVRAGAGVLLVVGMAWFFLRLRN